MVNYLVDSYYLNPKSELKTEEIYKKLKISNCIILEEFVSNMKKEKYIKYKKEKFLITYNGFIFLQSINESIKETVNNLINKLISISAFVISTYALWENQIMTILGTIFSFTILFIILKLTK